MKKRGSRSADDRMVSASDLAQMGRCEKLVVFEHLYGSRPSSHRQRAMARGLLEHEQFYREGAASAWRKGRCFVSTCVFGESWQTWELRRFRDKVLRPRNWGRRLIWFYYRVAPSICMALRRWPVLQRPVRMVMEVFAVALRRWKKWDGGGE